MQCLMQWTRRVQFLALASSLVAAAAAQGPSEVQPDKAKAYYHFSMGHMLQERGAMFNRPELLSQAIDEIELALQYDPSSTFLSMELADLYAATGRWQNALQEVEDNVRRNPSDPAARRLLGRLYVRLLAGGERGRQLPPELQQRAVRQFEEIIRRDPNDVSSYLILAQLYKASNETARAEETLKKALALQPDSGDATTQLALLYADVGDYRSAIDLLEKVVAKDDDPDLLATLAYAYEQVRDYSAAAGAYSRALQRDPENPAYRRGLGQNLLYDRKYDQALEQFQGLVESNPRDPESFVRLSQIYRFQRKYDLARESLAKAAELAPDNLEIQFNQVQLEETEGKTEEAIRLIQRVLDSSAKLGADSYTAQEKTNRGIFLEKLGALRREEGDFSAAESAFAQMVELGGDNAVRGRVRLMETYQENRQYDRALKASEEALAQNPDNREVVIARASLLAATGDADGATRLLQTLARDHAQDRELLLSVAQIHLRARQFEEALQLTAQAEELSESQDEKAYVSFLYGSIWERQKEFDKAEAEFRKALELDPENAMTLNYLGYMFADQGVHLEEAVDLIQRALDMEPNSGAYLDSLGWAYYRQDKLDLAEEYLQKAVDRIPTDPTIRDHLGDVYFKMGRVPQAVVEWKAALAEWNRLPKNEMEADQVANIERKLRDANAR
jgi:tetratricopeptide (TPR) repeat protein